MRWSSSENHDILLIVHVIIGRNIWPARSSCLTDLVMAIGFSKVGFRVLEMALMSNGLKASWKRLFVIFCQIFAIFDDFTKSRARQKRSFLRNFEKSSKIRPKMKKTHFCNRFLVTKTRISETCPITIDGGHFLLKKLSRIAHSALKIQQKKCNLGQLICLKN